MFFFLGQRVDRVGKAKKYQSHWVPSGRPSRGPDLSPAEVLYCVLEPKN